VSREILQQNRFIDSIRTASVKKILGVLETMVKDEPDKYTEFWAQFGQVLKEGPAEDYTNRERIAKLLRFVSSHSGSPEQNVALEDYIGRMKPEQDKIYYLTADSYAAASNSPHLEVFRKKGIEVLLLHDRVDEWLVSHLTEFDGKKLVSVAKGDLDLGKLQDAEEQKAAKQAEDENKDLVEKIRDVLEDVVGEVRISHRLTDSPSCLVQAEHEMAMHMQRLMKQAGHDVPLSKPSLEINPEHALVKRLRGEQDAEGFAVWARLLFEQALLTQGGQLDNPAAFVKRLNRILVELSET
jgi:molecular chaperone HtpG